MTTVLHGFFIPTVRVDDALHKPLCSLKHSSMLIKTLLWLIPAIALGIGIYRLWIGMLFDKLKTKFPLVSYRRVSSRFSSYKSETDINIRKYEELFTFKERWEIVKEVTGMNIFIAIAVFIVYIILAVLLHGAYDLFSLPDVSYPNRFIQIMIFVFYLLIAPITAWGVMNTYFNLLKEEIREIERLNFMKIMLAK